MMPSRARCRADRTRQGSPAVIAAMGGDRISRREDQPLKINSSTMIT